MGVYSNNTLIDEGFREMKINMFNREEKVKENWEKYADKAIEGVERIHTIGGFSLLVFVTGVSIIGVSLLANLAALKGVGLAIAVVSGALVSISGIALHFFEVRDKQAIYKISLEMFHSMTNSLWGVYIESLKKKDTIDSAQVKASIKDINNFLNIRTTDNDVPHS